MSTISVLPETTPQVLCVRYSGTVTADDFKKYHYNEMIKHADENGYLNMVVCYDKDYIGWEAEAAHANLKSIAELSARARKLAYVNPQKRKIFLMRMVNDLLKDAEIRYFKSDEYNEAVKWVKE